MGYESKNIYKLAREIAGYTQEQAAPLLGVSVHTISDYETDKTQIPSDIVEKMMDIYELPSLGFWHLQYVDPIGRKCLARQTYEPESKRELAFTSCTNSDAYAKTTEIIRKIMSNGQIDDTEVESFARWIEDLEIIISQAIKDISYAKILLLDKLKCDNGEIIKRFKKGLI